jgi:flagellar basal body P-ring formation protein FlgA
MIRCVKLSVYLFMLVHTPAVLFAADNKHASQYQEIALIKQAVESFIYSNTSGLSGQVIANIGNIDERITLPKCPELSPFLPTGARLWGKTAIGVRCNSQTSWTIYVQAEVKVMVNVLHVTQPITRGQSLNIGDIAPQQVNLTQMPEGIFTDPAQVIGKIATNNISSGQPLRQQMLRDPYIILRGQKVKLVAQGRGFSVTSEGQALADAAEGQVVQIRNQSGRIISGLARHNSIVEVQP